jgi:hypothetical protein
MMAGLNFLERVVVVNVLRPIVKIENDFGVAVRQDAIDGVSRVVAFVIDEMIDEPVQRKSGNVGLKNHFRKLPGSVCSAEILSLAHRRNETSLASLFALNRVLQDPIRHRLQGHG